MQDLPHSGVELRMYGLAVIFDRTVHMCVTLLGSCGLRVLSMTSASSRYSFVSGFVSAMLVSDTTGKI